MFYAARAEGFSISNAGTTIDFNATVFIGPGATLYSNRGEPLASVLEDDTGVHDILLAPCTAAALQIFHPR